MQWNAADRDRGDFLYTTTPDHVPLTCTPWGISGFGVLVNCNRLKLLTNYQTGKLYAGSYLGPTAKSFLEGSALTELRCFF
jgi:hypothetical protein